MELTNEQASDFVGRILTRLAGLNADDVIAGIDESRRLGIEQTVEMPNDGKHQGKKAKKARGTTVRRRRAEELSCQ